MKYYYYCNSWEKAEPDGGEHLFEVEHDVCEDEWEYEWLVEKCAKDYHSNHDGWEHSSWPNDSIEFWLYDQDKKFIGKYEVYLEFDPTFSAYRIKK